MLFAWEGLDGSEAVAGTLEAPGPAQARESLRRQGLVVTRLERARGRVSLSREIRLRKELRLGDLAWMARQLAITTESGMTLPKSLQILAGQRKGKRVGEVLSDVHSRILSGSSATAAFEAQRASCGSLVCAMISSGERSGRLGESFAKLAGLLETRDRLRKKVRSALMYPAGVFCLSLVLALAMVIFIVPRFEALFRQLGGSLPAPTRALVGLSHLLTHSAWALPLAAVALGVGWREARRRHGSRRRLEGLASRLPIVGGLLEKAVMARVSSSIATTLEAGVPLLEAMGYAADAAGNLVVADALREGAGDVRAGLSLSEALGRRKEVPEILSQMVRVGEDAGRVSEVLSRYASRLEMEVETAVEGLSALLEPVLVVVVGGIVGSIIVSLYLPLFKIITVLGQQKP